MAQLAVKEERSTSLLRLAGYILLLLSLFDLIGVFVPPRFMDPAWELQAMGAIVDRVPVPLIGLVLAFSGEANFRSSWEKFVLKLLSQASLLVGVLFLLLIPLGIVNGLRLKDLNDYQINTQVIQQKAQLQELKGQLGRATGADLSRVIARLNSQARPPSTKDPQALKTQLLTEIAQAETALQIKAEAGRRSRQLGLLKNLVKWNLGALVSGVAFIYIWRLTRWARRGSKRSQ